MKFAAGIGCPRLRQPRWRRDCRATPPLSSQELVLVGLAADAETTSVRYFCMLSTANQRAGAPIIHAQIIQFQDASIVITPVAGRCADSRPLVGLTNAANREPRVIRRPEGRCLASLSAYARPYGTRLTNVCLDQAQIRLRENQNAIFTPPDPAKPSPPGCPSVCDRLMVSAS